MAYFFIIIYLCGFESKSSPPCQTQPRPLASNNAMFPKSASEAWLFFVFPLSSRAMLEEQKEWNYLPDTSHLIVASLGQNCKV